MNVLIIDYLEKFKFGEVQRFDNMEAIPLFTPLNNSPEYITLKEAFEKRFLEVVEISQSGSVPELKVINKADIPVLLLDGEELVGAKQNRVLNTTILIKENSETVIPVSCTEQGRWSYVSSEFYDSDVVMAYRIRKRKTCDVSRNLEESKKFYSDQGRIWQSINELSNDAEVSSRTSAMKDVFEARKSDLEKYLDSFKYIPSQKGLFVFINGEIAGFDFISLESAYKLLHPKLIKSYAMDAILQRTKKTSEEPINKAIEFFLEIKTCNEKKYKSIGYGFDYRFDGKNIAGSSLVYNDKIIHMAFFRTTDDLKVGRISGYKRRRNFRTSIY